MTIGIIGAMDEEIALLQENMTNKKELDVANTLYIQGELKGQNVILLKSGIGKVNAAMATTIMHERFQPSYVINTGSAGGFREELEIGDIVISSKVVHHDVDVTVFSYRYGQVPGMPAMFSSNSKLTKIAQDVAEDLQLRSLTGVIASGDTFMEDPEKVAFVRSRFPTMIAAEMEAAAIAQVCHQYHKPFVIIRALSDIAGKESSISFDSFLTTAAKNAAKMIMKMIESI